MSDDNNERMADNSFGSFYEYAIDSSFTTADSPERIIAEKVVGGDPIGQVQIEPFDINQVTGYLEKVGRHPIDLQTISNKKSSQWICRCPMPNANAFWNDVNNVFQNAIKYHADLETKWISKLAKDMQKAVARERKAFENGGGSNSNNPKTKTKLPSWQKQQVQVLPPWHHHQQQSHRLHKPNPKSTLNCKQDSSVPTDSVGPDNSENTKKADKLKLKLSLKKKTDIPNESTVTTLQQLQIHKNHLLLLLPNKKSKLRREEEHRGGKNFPKVSRNHHHPIRNLPNPPLPIRKSKLTTLWGIGTKPDALTAHKMFQRGAPGGRMSFGPTVINILRS